MASGDAYLSSYIIYSNLVVADVASTDIKNYFYNCATPLTNAFTGVNIITNAPQFVNFANGNYRLAPSSPCVNTGTNQLDWMTNAVDLDGRPRIRYGIVDMGAYERINEGTIYGFR